MTPNFDEGTDKTHNIGIPDLIGEGVTTETKGHWIFWSKRLQRWVDTDTGLETKQCFCKGGKHERN
jgi:hypothetical protein